jgi:hypothetical protein
MTGFVPVTLLQNTLQSDGADAYVIKLRKMSKYIIIVITILINIIIISIRLDHKALSFSNMSEYRIWCERNCGGCGWEIMHIKGLASLSTTDTTELFSKFQRHLVKLEWNGTSDAKLLEIIFGDSTFCVANRKRLIQNFDPQEVVDYSGGSISCSEFVQKDLLSYYHHDIVRSIPSVVDGLNICQLP